MELLQYMKENARMLKELCVEVAMLREMVRGNGIGSRFLTMDEACKYLRISRTTMQRRLADGEIGFAVKQGKSWKFPAEELKRYASAC